MVNPSLTAFLHYDKMGRSRGFKGEEFLEVFLLDKVIAFLKNRNYEKGFGTCSLTLDYFKDNDKTYAFYINSNTDIVPIATDIVDNIEKYALDFLGSCSTLEKYENMLLYEKERMTYAAVMRYEWNL